MSLGNHRVPPDLGRSLDGRDGAEVREVGSGEHRKPGVDGGAGEGPSRLRRVIVREETFLESLVGHRDSGLGVGQSRPRDSGLGMGQSTRVGARSDSTRDPTSADVAMTEVWSGRDFGVPSPSMLSLRGGGGRRVVLYQITLSSRKFRLNKLDTYTVLGVEVETRAGPAARGRSETSQSLDVPCKDLKVETVLSRETERDPRPEDVPQTGGGWS